MVDGNTKVVITTKAVDREVNTRYASNLLQMRMADLAEALQLLGVYETEKYFVRVVNESDRGRS